MEKNKILLQNIEGLANELVGIWTDTLGTSPEVLSRMERDIYSICPVMIWQWGVGLNGQYPRVVVLGLNT